VGDRVSIRSLFVDQGLIELDLVQQGPDDAACCPTQKAFRGWKLGPDGLREVSSEVTGVLSVADLEGTEWVLTHLKWRERTPREPEVTLVVSGDTFSGSSGCNEYFTTVRETSPGEISVGEIGATKKLCPPEVMKLETSYLEALRGAMTYSFLGGRLALTYATDGGTETLIFVSRERLTGD
jgi:heat shock protein HslJ